MATHGQFATSAEGKPVDGRDEWFGAVFDAEKQILSTFCQRCAFLRSCP
jgi:hypothetical protein